MDDPAKLTLGFGKHRDDALEDLPEDYVEWLLREVDFEERFGADLGGLYVDELERQLKMKRGEGTVARRTVATTPPQKNVKPDPLPYAADCGCGVSMPVESRDPFACGRCGEMVYPT